MSVPPKVLKSEWMRLERQVMAGGPGAGGALSKNRPALPVLEAFQAFLDTERRRARRRLVGISCAFLVLFLGLGAAALVMGTLFYERVANRVLQVREDLIEMSAAQLESREKTLASVDDLDGRTDKLTDHIRRTATVLLSTRETVTEQTRKTDEEIRNMRMELARLSEENAVMRTDLERARAVLPVLYENMEALRERMESKAAEESVPEVEPEPTVAAPTSSVLTVLMRTRGQDQAIPWLLPLPPISPE